jgi:hypothetical protein
MKIDYEITEQDFLDAQRLAIKNHPIRMIRWTRLVLPLFGIFLFGAWIQNLVKQGFSLRATVAVIFPMLFISLPLLNKWNARKMYRKATILHGRVHLDVNEDSWVSSGPSFRGKVDWSNFSKFSEDDRVFVIYQNTQTFNIVPKHSLAPDQISELRQYLERNIGKSKSSS